MTHDALVQLDCASNERRLGLSGVGQELDDGIPHKGRVRGESRTPLETFPGRSAEQVKREVDRRSPPRHVVLEVRVQALVAKVELGGQRDHDDVEVERREP